MPDKTKWLSIGVGRRHPVTMRKASLMGLSMSRVRALRHQISAHYSAVEWTKARMVVRSTVVSAPQLDPANCLKIPTRDVNFLLCDSKCRRNVIALSSFMPRSVGSAQNVRASPLITMLNSDRASLL